MTEPIFDRRHSAAPRGGNRLFISVLLFAVIAMATLQVRAWWVGHAAAAVAPRTVTPRGDLGADEQATIQLFEQTSPSVVFITTVNLRQDFYTRNIYKIPAGTGSGFVWDKAGHVVTNFHVVAGAQRWEVTMSDGSAWEATVVGYEADKDLAVLKINAPSDLLHPIKVGESHNLLVGQKALAIGNPFGFDQTLTTGVISALGREIESMNRRPIQGVIQTNAAINPGNSGGPLLDSAGRLIGVNTAIFSPTGSYAGIGFAVPVDTVNRVVPQLIEHGKVVKPGLGVAMEEGYARRLGLKGVGIYNVTKGSGADMAGLKPMGRNQSGQIQFGLITGIDDAVIEGAKDLFRALDEREVGETVKVTVNTITVDRYSAKKGDPETFEVELSALAN